MERSATPLTLGMTFRETVKQHAVAISVNHLPSVPKRVIELLVIMYRRVEAQATPVYRIAIVCVLIKIVCGTGKILGFIDCNIERGLVIAFASHQRSRKISLMLCVVDRAAFLAGG